MAEHDPNGRAPHQPGSGKNRFGLVVAHFPRALHAIGRVETFLSETYGTDSWKTGPSALDRATDNMYLHLIGEQSGEQRDGKSQLLHAAHAAREAIARLELLLVQQHWQRSITVTPQEE